MTIHAIITYTASNAEREEAERSGHPWLVRGFEAWLATAEAFQDQDDIDPDALAAGIATIRARIEAGFDAGTYLALQGTRGGSSSASIWEEVLLAALATHIGLAGDLDLSELETVCRLGLA